jgi:hypothetical protein
MQIEAPGDEEAVPGGQRMQSDPLLRPSTGLYVPAGQLRSVPSVQYCPRGHSRLHGGTPTSV